MTSHPDYSRRVRSCVNYASTCLLIGTNPWVERIRVCALLTEIRATWLHVQNAEYFRAQTETLSREVLLLRRELMRLTGSDVIGGPPTFAVPVGAVVVESPRRRTRRVRR